MSASSHRTPLRRMSLMLAAGIVALGAVQLSAQDKAPPSASLDITPPAFKRPGYMEERHREDWSGLAGLDRSQTGDFWDPIKYVPLSEDGFVWASFGGQLRLRYEHWENWNSTAAQDDGFLLTRILLHGDIHFGEHFRVFLQGKSALSTDRDLPGGRTPLYVDTLDLQQAFADVNIPINDQASFRFRGGRQELLFGNQRLVSPLDWANTRRTWDGVRGDLSLGKYNIAGFWTQFVPVDKYDFNESSSDEQFWGVYATGPMPFITGVNIDAYYLGRERRLIDDERHTIGGRIFGKVGATPFDYEVEGAYQTGDSADLDVKAFMVAAELGYSFADFYGAPRLFVGFDYASGDDDPTDGDLGTFDQLYPLGHKYLGWIDIVGRQNIIAFNTGVQFKPLEKLIVNIHGHIFWLAETSDVLYNAGAATVLAGGTGDRDVGAEIDLLLRYQLDRHTLLMFGYSHFFTGDYFDGPGRGRDIDFVYFGLQYTF